VIKRHIEFSFETKSLVIIGVLCDETNLGDSDVGSEYFLLRVLALTSSTGSAKHEFMSTIALTPEARRMPHCMSNFMSARWGVTALLPSMDYVILVAPRPRATTGLHVGGVQRVDPTRWGNVTMYWTRTGAQMAPRPRATIGLLLGGV
jgi:hypothetical protein